MSILDLMFLFGFIVFSILLLLFGILSVIFNYSKFSKIRSRINSDKIDVSISLKKAMKSPFWIYIVFINSKLMNEIMNSVNRIDDIKTMHIRYNFFLKLQLIMLLLLVVLFIAYVLTNIFVAWFTNN